jgi:hypothetical protein
MLTASFNFPNQTAVDSRDAQGRNRIVISHRKRTSTTYDRRRQAFLIQIKALIHCWDDTVVTEPMEVACYLHAAPAPFPQAIEGVETTVFRISTT